MVAARALSTSKRTGADGASGREGHAGVYICVCVCVGVHL
jgi:hypothetical protein